MTERTVTTRLRAEVSQYQRDMRAAAMATVQAQTQIEKSGGRMGAGFQRAESKVKATTIAVDRFGAATKRADKDLGVVTKRLDTYSGRLGLAAEAVLYATPIMAAGGASAAAGVLALTNQVGAAAVAGGVLLTVFQGMGDALDALGKAKADPTAENIAELRRQLEQLSPAAAQAVRAIDDFKPILREIRNAGSQEYFPGFIESLDSLETRSGDLKRVTAAIGGALGDLTADAGAALASDEWDQFFGFLQTDAKDSVVDLGRSVGNLTRGFAELWMAFDPISDDMGSWLVKSSGDFAEWADGLDQTQNFHEFVAYVRANGPRVADTVGDVADAVLQIGEASAPLAGPVLATLSGFAKVVGAIADSDMGTPIMAGVLAVTALNRVLTVTQKLANMPATGFFGGVLSGREHRGADSSVAGVASRVRASIPTVSQFGTVLYRAGQSADHASEKTLAARRSVGDFAKQARPAVAGAGALAVATSGVADGFGLTNTATMGLAGSMAGPLGAAVGTGIGLMLDFADAQGKSADAAAQTDAALAANRTSVVGYVDILEKAAEEQEKLASSKSIWNLFQGDDQAARAASGYLDQLSGLGNIGHMLGKAQGTFKPNSFSWDVMPTAQELRVLENAAPAMEALGISLEDLNAAYAQGGKSGAAPLIEKILNFQAYAESGVGKVDAFADAIGDMGDESITAAESAAQLAGVFNNLFGPKLNAEQALDAWHTGLDTLKEKLNDRSGFEGFSKGAKENRAASVEYLTSVQERLTTLAGLTTTTEGDMARALEESRKKFIESGVAAGFDAAEMKKRANVMGLTPKLITTVFNAEGITDAERLAYQLRSAYEKLPPEVATVLQAKGVDLSQAEIEELGRKYKDVPGLVETLVGLKSAGAKLGISEVDGLLAALERRKTIAKLMADGSQARGEVARTQGTIDGLQGKTVVLTTIMETVTSTKAPRTTVRTSKNAPPTLFDKKATGGLISGPGSGTSDDVPIWASDGEFMQRHAAVQHYGVDFMEDVNAMRFPRPEGYASGGQIKKKKGPTKAEREAAAKKRREREQALDWLWKDDYSRQVLKRSGSGVKARNLDDHLANSKFQAKARTSVKKVENSDFDLVAKPFLKDWESRNKAIEANSKKLEKATEGLDHLVSSQDDLKSSIIDTFTSDLFAKPTDGWADPKKGPMGTLNDDIADLNALGKAESRLDDVLKGDALAAVLKGGLGAAQDMAGWTNAQLAEYQKKFDDRAALAQRTGNNAADSAYGPMIAAQQKVVDALERNQLKQEKRLARFEARIDAWPEKFADALSKTAAKGKAKKK